MSEEERRAAYRQFRAARPDLFEPRADGQYRIWPDGGEVCYQDGYVAVLKDRIRFPDGADGTYLRIVAPPQQAPGAVILPFTAQGVVLLDQPRHAAGRSLLEAPRGFGESGEDARGCAARELREELGVTAIQLHALGHIYPDSGLLETRVALFAAELAEDAALTTETGTTAVIVAPAECERAIADGGIEDGFTIAAFYRARLAKLI